jgi:hypothetical protein
VLHTDKGAIELALPTTINATITSKTAQGISICDHYVTLKPYTTKINADTWTRLKKEFEGTMGSGEAEIKLTSLHGNISITKPA